MSWMDYTTDGWAGRLHDQSTIGKAPAFSLRGRHKESSKDAGPGPAQYDVTNGMKATKRSLPSFSLSSRTQTLDKKNVPGPGAYTVSDIVGKRRLLRSPLWKACGRRQQRQPGAGAYENNYLSTGKDAPAASLSGRHPDLAKNTNPGPGAYNVDNDRVINRSEPAFSLSGRYDVTKTNETPAQGVWCSRRAGWSCIHPSKPYKMHVKPVD